MSDTNTAVLSTVASNLAVKLSDLSQQLEIPTDTLQPVLDELLEHEWVKVQPIGGEMIYLITADGVRELERNPKRWKPFSFWKK